MTIADFDRSDALVNPDTGAAVPYADARELLEERVPNAASVVRDVLEVCGEVASCLVLGKTLMMPKRIVIEVEMPHGAIVRSTWLDKSGMN